MRRWLALVLFCLLPLQASWAAVADYCAHEPSGAQHFGHHDDEHELQPGNAEDQAQSGTSELGHDHCHCASFLGLLGDASVVLSPSWSGSLRSDKRFPPASPPAVQPERPKWSVPA
jgi:hypothetical protein